MIEASRALVEALASAYRPHLERRCGEMGVEWDDELETAAGHGRDWLRAELTALLEQPFRSQRRGPLEVFQEAMRFPTGVLTHRDTPAAVRDEATAAALPGDLFDLAPASSSVLGEDAWRAHLAWGAAKAAAMMAPPGDGAD